MRQRQVQRLKHQTGRAGRADVDGEVAGDIVRGRKRQLAGTDGCAGDLRLTKYGGGLDGLQVLGPQTRLVPIGPDLLHAKRPAGQAARASARCGGSGRRPRRASRPARLGRDRGAR